MAELDQATAARRRAESVFPLTATQKSELAFKKAYQVISVKVILRLTGVSLTPYIVWRESVPVFELCIVLSHWPTFISAFSFFFYSRFYDKFVLLAARGKV